MPKSRSGLPELGKVSIWTRRAQALPAERLDERDGPTRLNPDNRTERQARPYRLQWPARVPPRAAS
jgi:hypothetical protein